MFEETREEPEWSSSTFPKSKHRSGPPALCVTMAMYTSDPKPLGKTRGFPWKQSLFSKVEPVQVQADTLKGLDQKGGPEPKSR